MEALVLEGIRPYDGTYPLNLKEQPLTIREWGWIKKLSGYLPVNAGDGFIGSDPELMLVLAVILLRRAGKIQTDNVLDIYERFVDEKFGVLRWATIRAPGEEDEEDEDPTESSRANTSSSGPASSETSGTSDGIPPRTGMPASDSSPSALTTSGN